MVLRGQPDLRCVDHLPMPEEHLMPDRVDHQINQACSDLVGAEGRVCRGQYGPAFYGSNLVTASHPLMRRNLLNN
jgi:hypothetical protein